MIWIGIDDTDTLDSPGTNQLARAIAQAAAPGWRCECIVRHQLFFDPRVPYTSKNGSASLTMRHVNGESTSELVEICQSVMRDRFVEGSDPGLCVTEHVPHDVIEFGRRCKSTLVEQDEAHMLAAQHNFYLEGLGGTEQGVIGALAAVGLALTGNDGRIVQLGEWPDDLAGVQPIELVRERGVRLHDIDGDSSVARGRVDLGKRLRPNRREGQAVLFVQRVETDGSSPLYRALKLP